MPAELRGSVASLLEHCGPLELPRVAAAVLAALRVWYDALAVSGPAVVAAWRARAAPWWGEPVEVSTAGLVLSGRLLDVDDEGALLVAGADGATRRVLSGEVLRVRRRG
jgi:biotin-(acetyl-CoA carboxylase) ligase